MTSLDQAIEDFYATFVDAPAPDQIEACPHCISFEEIKKLLMTPLRELTADDLGSYASSAFLTAGDVADYLYFLPRILDITIHDDSWWPSIEVTARAVVSSDLHAWPQKCRESLEALLRAVVKKLTDDGPHHELDSWMCAIGRMDLDVQPYLSIIERNSAAVLEFWTANSGKLYLGQLGNAFWEEPNKQHNAIVEWLNSPRIKLIYAEAYGYRTR
jgi:hypothetical protein